MTLEKNKPLDLALQFHQLKFQYLPNISVDYIAGFSIDQRKDRLKQCRGVKFVCHYFLLWGYFLKIHFTDGTAIHFRISKKDLRNMNTSVALANKYLQQLRDLKS